MKIEFLDVGSVLKVLIFKFWSGFYFWIDGILVLKGGLLQNLCCLEESLRYCF